MPLRAAAICGLLAPVTVVAGLLFGDLAQPDAFSPAKDNISDIGAQTADQAWIHNQIAANLNGLLILAFALGGMDRDCANTSWQADAHPQWRDLWLPTRGG